MPGLAYRKEHTQLLIYNRKELRCGVRGSDKQLVVVFVLFLLLLPATAGRLRGVHQHQYQHLYVCGRPALGCLYNTSGHSLSHAFR